MHRINFTLPQSAVTLTFSELVVVTAPTLGEPLRIYARGNPLEFLDEAYLAKTRVMGLPYGKNFIIPTSTVFVRFTDRQTDGQADGRATGIFNVPSHCLGFAVQSWDF